MEAIEPRRVVRQAQYGEVGNIGRAANEPEKDYIDGARLAAEDDGVAIIVREFDLQAEPVARDTPAALEQEKGRVKAHNDAVISHVQREVATQRRLLTKLDQSGNALADWPVLGVPAEDPQGQAIDTAAPSNPPERFQVSQATVGDVVRTVIVFYPEGRPITRRRSPGEADGGGEDA